MSQCSEWVTYLLISAAVVDNWQRQRHYQLHLQRQRQRHWERFSHFVWNIQKGFSHSGIFWIMCHGVDLLINIPLWCTLTTDLTKASFSFVFFWRNSDRGSVGGALPGSWPCPAWPLARPPQPPSLTVGRSFETQRLSSPNYPQSPLVSAPTESRFPSFQLKHCLVFTLIRSRLFSLLTDGTL